MNVRAKAKLEKVVEMVGQKTFFFNPVCDDNTEENKKFSKHTPSGLFEMTVTNTAVLDQFEIGKEYYVDFTPAE